MYNLKLQNRYNKQRNKKIYKKFKSSKTSKTFSYKIKQL